MGSLEPHAIIMAVAVASGCMIQPRPAPRPLSALLLKLSMVRGGWTSGSWVTAAGALSGPVMCNRAKLRSMERMDVGESTVVTSASTVVGC